MDAPLTELVSDRFPPVLRARSDEGVVLRMVNAMGLLDADGFQNIHVAICVRLRNYCTELVTIGIAGSLQLMLLDHVRRNVWLCDPRHILTLHTPTMLKGGLLKLQLGDLQPLADPPC